MAYAHDIKTLLTIGKNIVIEFKRAGNGPEHDTYESICAFLNRQGGDVLLGVTDDGEVTGLPPKAAPEMVRRIVNVMNDPNLWEPRIALYPEIVVYSGKTIIRIHVPTGPDVYRFKGKCYDRVNEADVVVRGTAPIADSGVRNLYHYVKLYSGADPIFDEEDVFRLTVPLNSEHSPEKSGGETTRKTTPKTTLQTTLSTTLKTPEKSGGKNNETVNETVKRLIEARPGIGSARIIEATGKSRASVMRAIAFLKSINAIEHRGSDKTGGYYAI